VSPDGKEIVFDLLGDIYVLPIQGAPPKRCAAACPWKYNRFSPDGKFIAFTSDAVVATTSG